MENFKSQEKRAEALNAATKNKGIEVNRNKLSSLMDSIICKAKEVQSECAKEHPEMWRLCDLAIDDLESLFDEVNMCVFARCMNEAGTHRGELPIPNVARFYKSIDALPED